RGLDYYTGVVFEFEAPDLGAEKQICGGGSYTLTEVFGGQPTPTAGFGLGFDRVLLASDLEPERTGPQVHIAPIGDAARHPAGEIASTLRKAGIPCTLDINERGPSKNLDFADKNAIPKVLLLGSRELEEGVATVKDMASGEQTTVDLDDLVEHLSG
ncbi:MAG: His/Gly/Thr/Pro-type tRNA ligase C-terminal domain-containing protein, partial [Candidatus Thermoplasmatota archaeon]|nr:His/Gly/Thr/Pro-type tRNA ligase C-terminal domain-containing protein [Candidatus Thermoplasmatota archaeon]